MCVRLPGFCLLPPFGVRNDSSFGINKDPLSARLHHTLSLMEYINHGGAENPVCFAELFQHKPLPSVSTQHNILGQNDQTLHVMQLWVILTEDPEHS